MGCGLIYKNSNVESNEIDLCSHITKLPQQSSMFDTNIANSKISDGNLNINIKVKKEAKPLKIIKKYDKSKSISSKNFIINDYKKTNASGPIFNILKQTVDNYKMNKSKSFND